MITVFGRAIRPSSLTRFVLLAALAVGLMILDHRGNHLARIRDALSVLAIPVHFVASLPPRIGGAVFDFFTTSTTLREHNTVLQTERQQLLAKLQQFDALEAENNRLRAMLGSATRVADKALAADLIEVSSEPFTRHIVLSRGERDGVYLRQPVIDAYGIMGQITQVGPLTSRATLITDPGHAIPVLVSRNGLRAIVFGTGAADRVKIPYLTATADIREGDVLISSGMGGIFPPDYPVAKIEQIVNDPNEPFLDIGARPAARLNHSKQVLLIWPGRLTPTPPPAAKEPKKDARKEAKKK
jgi:rod shape-determining protein MreC